MSDGRLVRATPRRGWSLGAVGATFFAAALAASFASTTAMVADNRVEQFVNPARRLVRMLYMWDPTRGLGRVREDFWPGETIPLAVLRGVGLSPAASQHVWHAALIAAGATGLVALLRVWWPRVGWLHAVAAIVWAFGPYSATFLLPSNLYYHYALAPWAALCLVRGTEHSPSADPQFARRPWRYEAAFALLIASAGNADMPGLLFLGAALVPLTLFVVLIERRATWGSFFVWVGRAGVLTLACSVVWLYKSLASAGTYANRLNSTELARNVSFASSFAESWRGLGSWLSYFQDRHGFTRPQGAMLFENVAIVAATVSIPILSVIGARPALTRGARHRSAPDAQAAAPARGVSRRVELWFAASMLMALVVLVAAFPRSQPSPYGQTLLAAFRVVPGLSAMRNSYKFGSALMLGMAPLVGLAVVRLVRSARRSRSWWRRFAAGWAVLAVIGAAAPFWTGSLYDESRTTRSTPDYWNEALAWLDEQPAPGRVFVAPGTTRADYRWGHFGDDLLDARLRRPHVVDLSVPLSTPIGASIVRATDVAAADRNGEVNPGFVATLRRMGVRYVLVRNDLRWERIGIARPAFYKGLRDDPGLRLVRSFGEPGTNTVAASSAATSTATRPGDAAYERTLAPIEIYEVSNPRADIAWGWDTSRSTLVAGDGYALPALAEAGVISSDEPVEFTASLTDTQLLERLRAEPEVVITDSNRRRVVVNDGWRADVGETLSLGTSAGRVVSDAFLVDHPGAETTATFGEAQSVLSTGPARPASGFQNWNRPSQAFDGDPLTQWLTAGFDNPIGRALRVDFDEPKVVGFAAVSVANRGLGGRVVSGASLVLSDGSTFPLDLSAGYAEVGFPSRAIRWAEVRIDAVSGDGNSSVGFNEVRVGALDMRERIALPTDLFAAASRRAGIGQALDRSVITYAMSSLDGVGLDREERALRRTFVSRGERLASLQGEFRLDATTGEQVLDSLLELPVFAGGTARDRGDLRGLGVFAVDGDLETAWAAPAVAGHVLSVRVPSTALSSVVVHLDGREGMSRATNVFVDVAGQRVSAEVEYPDSCVDAQTCSGTARVTFPAPLPNVTALSVTLGSVQRAVAAGAAADSAAGPVRVLEVDVNEQPNAALDLAAPVSPGCRGLVVALDDEWVPVSIDASIGDVVRGKRISFSSCDDIELDAGEHAIDTGVGPTLESVVVRTVPVSRAADLNVDGAQDDPPGVSGVVVTASGPSALRVTVTGQGGLVTNGQSWDPRWTATSDGRPLGAPRMVDGLSAWVVGPGTHELVMRMAGETPFRGALIVSVLAVTCCVWLVFGRRRGHHGAD